jgi:hypothetical protein
MPLPPTPAAPLKVVPKGLRSFDARDADFFLELLPGPRDRDELPDSIRFWKQRIDEIDPDQTFAVGLLYGPSGCGKSSLVKAGLLPRLEPHVHAVYVEATAEETEARLLKGLGKQGLDLPAGLGLLDSLTALRRGRLVPAGRKVLLVLDQFEQWLHARRGEADPELVQALRQCDGGRVQALLLVRDDFWMAVTRFMHRLEIRVVEGGNSAAVDLFDPAHARKVLAAFGRAFGRLADPREGSAKEPEAFLDQAVAGLSQDGRVVPVRLALFAEMVNGKPWTPATLRQVGGTEGVGVTFLEETFSAATAPPAHRWHQRAARAVLQALLPESGSPIKGQMRAEAALRALCGYTGQPRDFADLLRILDAELRLITPTDPESIEPASGGRQPPVSATEHGVNTPRSPERYYQLTHDYLVPTLRQWLLRKQKETRRGRAELRLAERAALWQGKRENRHLPAWWEWATIRLFTRKQEWTTPQRQMMHKATRYHGLRATLLALVLVALTAAGLEFKAWRDAERAAVAEQRDRDQAAALVQQILKVDTAEVPKLLPELERHRRWADDRLRTELAQADPKSRERLHASLALLPVDADQADYLCGRLLEAEPRDVLILRQALADAGAGPRLRERLWAAVEQPEKDNPNQRLAAAGALALFDSQSPRWEKAGPALVEQLVRVHAVYLGSWLEALRPVGRRLRAPLAAVFRDASRRETERS